jgi:hypothetical protein
MTQYFYRTLALTAAGYNSENFGGKTGNFVARELAGVAAQIVIEGPEGRVTIDIAANGTAKRQRTRFDSFIVTGNGATVVMEIAGPDPWEFTDPATLTGTIGISGTIPVSGTVTANVGSTGGLALENGNLKQIQIDVSAIRAQTDLMKFTSPGRSLNVITGT